MIEPCSIIADCDGSSLPWHCHLAEVFGEGHIITVLCEFLDADDLCLELQYIKYLLENNLVVLFHTINVKHHGSCFLGLTHKVFCYSDLCVDWLAINEVCVIICNMTCCSTVNEE